MDNQQKTEKLEGFMRQHLSEDELNHKIEELAKEEPYEPYGALPEKEEDPFEHDMS